MLPTRYSRPRSICSFFSPLMTKYTRPTSYQEYKTPRIDFSAADHISITKINLSQDFFIRIFKYRVESNIIDSSFAVAVSFCYIN